MEEVLPYAGTPHVGPINFNTDDPVTSLRYIDGEWKTSSEVVIGDLIRYSNFSKPMQFEEIDETPPMPGDHPVIKGLLYKKAGSDGLWWQTNTGEVDLAADMKISVSDVNDNLTYDDAKGVLTLTANPTFGTVIVDNNLYVAGTTTTVNTTNLLVSDAFIKIADGNILPGTDVGFYTTFRTDPDDVLTTRYAGLYRDGTESAWYLFDHVSTPDPGPGQGFNPALTDVSKYGTLYLNTLNATSVKVSGLTASTLVLTDGSKNLTSLAVGDNTQYLRGDNTYQTLNQAAVSGLTTGSSPTFTGLNLSGTARIGSTSVTNHGALVINGRLNITDSNTIQTYGAGISTELGGGLLQFGINQGRLGGIRNTATNGGFFRFDTRTSYPFFQLMTVMSPNSEVHITPICSWASGETVVGLQAVADEFAGVSAPFRNTGMFLQSYGGVQSWGNMNGLSLTNAYGMLVDQLSNGTVTNAYGGYFNNPGIGSTRTALFATNMAIGTYTGTSPPSNGMIISGNVGIGKNSASTALDVNGTVTATNLTCTTNLFVGPYSAVTPFYSTATYTNVVWTFGTNSATATLRVVRIGRIVSLSFAPFIITPTGTQTSRITSPVGTLATEFRPVGYFMQAPCNIIVNGLYQIGRIVIMTDGQVVLSAPGFDSGDGNYTNSSYYTGINNWINTTISYQLH